MPAHNQRKVKKAGLPPGSVIFTGNQKVEKVFIHYLCYDESELKERVLDNHDEIRLSPSLDHKIDWYDLRGLHDVNLIELLGSTFNIHPLILEDVADVNQRPKFEEYDKGNFIVLRFLSFDKEQLKVITEQVTLFFRKGILISFQERETDLFESVRHRLKSNRGRIRRRGSDYLCYALLDSIVDHYFLILDEVEEVMEDLEEKLLNDPDGSIRENIHHLKKELLVIRKSIGPLREAVSRFAKSESVDIDESTSVFLRDLYDHTIQIMDITETYRDTLNGLQDLYLSEISFRMNQVMQVLTIITTIFVPLSFLAGLYGMNFEFIPELKYRYGYFMLLGVMFLLTVSLLIFFRRKKWF